MEFSRPPAVECGIDRGFAFFREYSILEEEEGAEGG